MTCPNCHAVFLLSRHPSDPAWGTPARPEAEMACPACTIVGPAKDFDATPFPTWQAGIEHFLMQVGQQQATAKIGSA